MHQPLPTHHNRYINHTHSQPLPLARPSFPPFQQHPQIPNQHFNPVPNHVFQGPTHIQPPHPHQIQKLPPSGPIPAQRWEDIIPQPVINQPIMRPHEQTVTFRGNATGGKPSNKELLARADLILARSPPRQNSILQVPQPRISAHKEQPRTSHHSHQPAQTLQTFASPRPGYLETFTSPVRNAFEVPRSLPATLPRSQAEFPPHAFVSPPREQIIRTLPTEYHTSPPQHIFHAPPPHFIAPNIIRHEVRPEMIPYQIPGPIPTEIERPVPLLKPAPRPGQVHHMPLESAQFPPTSELSEIRRDFAQLRIDNEPREGFETLTPTPLRIVTEEPVLMPVRMLDFVPEIMEDEEASDYIPQIIEETDRGNHGRSNQPRNNKIQKKLVAEPGYEKQQQYSHPNIGKRFISGQQSGGSSARRNPYIKNSNGNTGQLVKVPRDTQASSSVRDSADTNRKSSGQFLRAPRETQTAPGVRDTERTNRKSSISEYIEERPRVTTPNRREESVQTLNFSPKAEAMNFKKEEIPKNAQAWIYSPNSERANVKKEEDPQEVKTWVYSPNSERVNEKKQEAPKDVKTWIYTPSTESVRKQERQENSETQKKERESKYTNKVEVSLPSGNQQGTDVKPKNRKMMKKVEEVVF